MSPDDIKAARHSLGLSLSELAELLGYTGNHARVQMDDLETGRRPLRECQRRLLQAYLEGYRPSDWPR
jgi:DNA-binding transcriptional regulator YiaG